MAEDEDHELPDRVLVYARKRPPLKEMGESDDVVQVADNSQNCVLKPGDKGAKNFSYDHVFNEKATQQEVYATVAQPMIKDVMRGYHGTVLAYGQTGSGKTHSLLHTGEGKGPEEAGVVPRLFTELFQRVAQDYKNTYDIHASMFQIYNEQVDDLLRPKKTGLKLNQSKSGGWQVENLSWFRAKSPDFLMNVFNNGRRNLIYAETHLNKHSSRSHAILQLAVNRREAVEADFSDDEEGEDARTEDMREVTQTEGLLTVVDLAGSERVKRSQSEGQRFTEATNINTSLLAFGNCVQALAEKRPHVPYRDSVLTRIMERSLSGKARTSLLVCLSPTAEAAPETSSALEFAQRAMRIDVSPEQRMQTVKITSQELAKQLNEAAGQDPLGEASSRLRHLERELERERSRKEDQEKRARGLEVQLEAQREEAERAAAQAAEARAQEERARREAEEREGRERQVREESERQAKLADDKAKELTDALMRAREAEEEAKKRHEELAQRTQELAEVRQALAEGRQDKERLKEREQELEGEVEQAKRRADEAASEAAQLTAQLAVVKAAHEEESNALRKRIDEAESAQSAEADERRRNETRIADLERQLAAKASHAARVESALNGQRAAVAALQRELREARGGTAQAENTLLRGGVPAVKLAGKNGKPLQRVVRYHPDSQRLEWASIGAFKSSMQATSAELSGSDPDNQVLFVKGPERNLTIRLAHDSSSTDDPVRAWARALTSQLHSGQVYSSPSTQGHGAGSSQAQPHA